MTITFELKIEEVNYLLSVLSQRPFSEVAELISKIRGQAQPQITQKTEEDN